MYMHKLKSIFMRILYSLKEKATQPYMELQPTNPARRQALQLDAATAPIAAADPRVRTQAQPTSSHQVTDTITSPGICSCKGRVVIAPLQIYLDQ